MKKLLFLSLISLPFIFTSCNKEKKTLENEVNDIEVIETPKVLDITQYEGTYQGILPCIKNDCDEIELTVQLLPNNNFIYSTKRVGIDDEPLMTTGIFEVNEEKNIITLEQIADVPNSFYLADGKIYQLDKNEEKITGPNADKFVLLKK